MPKIEQDEPEVLRPYQFHGVNVDPARNGDEAYGDCPFCGRERKWSVNVKTDQWQCKVCAEGTDRGGGNLRVFLRHLWKLSDEGTNGATNVLAEERKLLFPDTLTHWGVCQSALDNTWLVPGWSIDGQLNQLYKYARGINGKMTLFPTPTLGHQLHGVNLFNKSADTIYLCEGPWDGMALWEVLRQTKAGEGGYLLTGNPEASLLANANVLAVPGCGVFNEAWLPLFGDKRVVIMYDSDHPRPHPKTGAMQEPVGFYHLKRIVGVILAKAEASPKELLYLKWGPDGYDPKMPSGYDVRDALCVGPASARVAAFAALVDRITPVPVEWSSGERSGVSKNGQPEIECLPCDDWKELVNEWRKAMDWTEGLDRAFSVMLASVMSVPLPGDPIWCKIMGPPSCGKSTLCEALAVNKKRVKANSTMRGFHSGHKTDGDGKEDHSLLLHLFNKALVTKDGDTVLKLPNKSQIFSEARDIYDGCSRVHYRHGIHRDYEGIKMIWILCGTAALREVDSSELGGRFIDCVIMEGIDEELEDRIAWRVANRSIRNLKIEDDRRLPSLDEDLLKAMQKTGGYIEHLILNAKAMMRAIEMAPEHVRTCTKFARFIAYMRARPSIHQEESVEREASYRLTAQMSRLAMCLAAVLSKDEVDDEVMRRVKRVALDTSRGRVLEVAKQMYAAGEEGIEARTLAVLTNETDDKQRPLLRYLRRIEMVEAYVAKTIMNSRPRWRLTEKVTKLYSEVISDD
jgi:hypothetical protein